MKIVTRAGSYLDTSFMFKLYLPEQDSKEAVVWFQENRADVFVSALTDVELFTSFLRWDSEAVARRAIEKYRQNSAANAYVRLEMDADVFDRAADIAERYSQQYKLRSLDILHLATALRYGIAAFGTYDKRLAEAAAGMGLRVLPERS